MAIPVTCRKYTLPKLKKQLSKRKLMARFKEALSKVILNVFFIIN